MKNTQPDPLPVSERLTLGETIWDLSSFLARQWVKMACRDLHTPLFLWWRKAREGERIACPIIAAEQPNEDFTRSIRLSNAWPSQIAMRKINEALQSAEIVGKDFSS
jgi:hypothetical protein